MEFQNDNHDKEIGTILKLTPLSDVIPKISDI